MCVVALAWQVHADWPLILVGNRDEFHARPAAALGEWDDGSGIVAGRDLQAGGTWLGVHGPSGRVIVVTNVRGAMPDPDKASRGALVVDMLRGAGRFADPVEADLDRFNAFNLLTIDREGARLLTNRPQPQIIALEPGVRALANEPIDQPCARAERLAERLRSEARRKEPDFFALADLLRSDENPALFLHGETYGTRCSTLVAASRSGHIMIVERRYDAAGRTTGRTSLTVP